MWFVWFWLFLGGFFVRGNNGTTSSAIPSIISDCYTNNLTQSAEPPFTIPILIHLIRKLEKLENGLNLRTLAASMLHGVIFDGVIYFPPSPEHEDFIGLPYRAAGKQFFKYKLITDYLTSGTNQLFPVESLTPPELCYLHKMVSNTVNFWRRGDESRTCIHKSSMPLAIEMIIEDNPVSECPIRQGVIKTKWGPISPGHLIYAVASSLQRTRAKFQTINEAININENNTLTENYPLLFNDYNVDNLWLATIAGDLAGIILNQHTRTPEIAVKGFWNDTLLPRIYYLKSDKWDMSEPDLLGGIDALLIGSNLAHWNENSIRLKLSQIIDMFYSNRGIVYNKGYKAANRSLLLSDLFKNINLENQVAGAAKLLQNIGTYDVYLRQDEIDELALIVTKKFKEIAGNIAQSYNNVEDLNNEKMKSPLEIIVIIDGTYDFYTSQQVLYGLAETIQLSNYGSKLGIINGESGKWIANVTNDLFQLFIDLNKVETQWPTVLALGRSLETVIYYYENQTSRACLSGISQPLGKSVLILSSKGQLTDNDLTASIAAITTIKQAYPEINVIFATSNENKKKFDQLLNNLRDNDLVVIPPKDPISFNQHISQILTNISANIINYFCKENHRFEDYITPDSETFYQIRKEYLSNNAITTIFSNNNYGELEICAITNTNIICKHLALNGQINFDSKLLCGHEITCNIDFVVTVNSSKFLCAEDDCRYPDQVRMDISWRLSSGSMPVAWLTSYLVLELVLLNI